MPVPLLNASIISCLSLWLSKFDLSLSNITSPSLFTIVNLTEFPLNLYIGFLSSSSIFFLKYLIWTSTVLVSPIYSYPHILSNKVSLVKIFPLFLIKISSSSNSLSVKSNFLSLTRISLLSKSAVKFPKTKILFSGSEIENLLNTAFTLASSSLTEKGLVI